MIKQILVAALATVASTPAFAWWDKGHMEVAALAYAKLDPTVRQTADALINKHPAYSLWISGFSGTPDQIAKHAFVRAAVWADDIKDPLSCRTLHNVPPCYSAENDPTTGPTSNQNIGTSDLLQHAYWHFHDFVFSLDDTVPPKQTEIDKAANALSEIRIMRNALADPATMPDLRTYDLVWLLHLVGDAHQPLHGVARYSRGTEAGPHREQGDRGGNDENIVDANGAPIKDAEGKLEHLHQFWDGLPGQGGTPEQADAAAATLPPADVSLAAISDPAIWFDEDAQIAQSVAYAGIGDIDMPSTLNATYQATAHQIADQRIALAGVRLANLLNDALR